MHRVTCTTTHVHVMTMHYFHYILKVEMSGNAPLFKERLCIHYTLKVEMSGNAPLFKERFMIRIGVSCVTLCMHTKSILPP